MALERKGEDGEEQADRVADDDEVATLRRAEQHAGEVRQRERLLLLEIRHIDRLRGHQPGAENDEQQ